MHPVITNRHGARGGFLDGVSKAHPCGIRVGQVRLIDDTGGDLAGAGQCPPHGTGHTLAGLDHPLPDAVRKIELQAILNDRPPVATPGEVTAHLFGLHDVWCWRVCPQDCPKSLG